MPLGRSVWRYYYNYSYLPNVACNQGSNTARFRPHPTRRTSLSGAARTPLLAMAAANVDALTRRLRRLPWGLWLRPRTAVSVGICRSVSSVSPVPTPDNNRLSRILMIDPEVRRAIDHGQPVVALESTIVAHGMPYPHNFKLCQRLSTLLRSKGVVPATIAIKNGICRVGLSFAELHDLARAGEQGRASKCSTRDISLLLSSFRQQHLVDSTLLPHTKDADAETGSSSSSSDVVQWGATTVASTMRLAHLAGIATFVTGGMGGVHRHGHVTMDVSADVHELSRTPVVVVSAGIKSILDIPRTLQVLETFGVPTVAYQTNNFPAFFSPDSGVATPCRMDSCTEIAAAYWMARALKLDHGMLVAIPNMTLAAPSSTGSSTDDADSSTTTAAAVAAESGANVERAIQAALEECEVLGVTGQAVTPFILKRVAEKSGGDSLRSNIALVERNAAVGADIAVAIARQQHQQDEGRTLSLGHTVSEPFASPSLPQPHQSKVVVMGGAVLDIISKPVPGQQLHLGTSFPAVCTESDGGVGRNIAEVLGRLGSQPLLYSAVGKDSRGLAMMDRLAGMCGVSLPRETIALVDGTTTATYVAVLNEEGDLHTACADMTVLSYIPPPPYNVIQQALMLVMDANPPLDLMRQTAQQAVQAGVPVFLDPTSVTKAIKVAEDEVLMACLTFVAPNLDELAAMSGYDPFEIKTCNDAKQRATERLIQRMSHHGAHVLVTCGSDGVWLASREDRLDSVLFQHFPAPADISVGNATGAGDTLAGAFIHALLNGHSMSEAVWFGIRAATISVKCADRAISPELSAIPLSI